MPDCTVGIHGKRSLIESEKKHAGVLCTRDPGEEKRADAMIKINAK